MKTGLFAWEGYGNFGDDLLGIAARQLFSGLDLEPYYEKRKWFTGSFTLATRNFQQIKVPVLSPGVLIFAGGGMIATDQNTATIERWIRHLSNKKFSVFAFGIGVGPIRSGTERLTRNLLSTFESPIYVRSQNDLTQLEKIDLEGSLACDPVLLINLSKLGLVERKETNAVHHFAPWSSHWPVLDKYSYQTLIKTWESDFSESKPLKYEYSSNFKQSAYDQGIVQTALSKHISEIRSAKNIASSRLHTSIVAGMLGVPQFCIPYGRKFELLTELGLRLSSADHAIMNEVFDPYQVEKVISRGRRMLDSLRVSIERFTR
jgi:polysaccharide pyruvyl transferase WcaK-like protein